MLIRKEFPILACAILLLVVSQGFTFAQSTNTDATGETIWKKYVKTSADPVVQEAYDEIIREVGLDEADKSNDSISDEKQKRLLSILQSIVSALPEKVKSRKRKGSCINESKGKPYPVDHPAVRLAAIAWITRTHHVHELIPALVPFIDFKLDSRIADRADLDTKFLHIVEIPGVDAKKFYHDMNVHNHPVFEMVFELGKESVDGLSKFLESMSWNALERYTDESFRVMKVVGILSELAEDGDVTDVQAARIASALDNLAGDSVTVSAAKLAWQYRVGLDNIDWFYGCIDKKPEFAIKQAESKFTLPMPRRPKW